MPHERPTDQTVDGEDHVMFLIDPGFLRGESGWRTMTVDQPSPFITRDGNTFLGETPVEHMGNGQASTLSFEAHCP
jgi:hypothetical protein